MNEKYQKYKATYQAYRINHPEQAIESSRRRREKFKDACNAQNRKWRKIHPEKKFAGNIISNHSEKFPLDIECELCGVTDKLEHGHIDYDYPELYLTVCHRCNYWMNMGRGTV